VERLREEGNAAFKAGRLNEFEADGSPGREVWNTESLTIFLSMPVIQRVGEATVAAEQMRATLLSNNMYDDKDVSLLDETVIASKVVKANTDFFSRLMLWPVPARVKLIVLFVFNCRVIRPYLTAVFIV
jgi:hypothetical protein